MTTTPTSLADPTPEALATMVQAKAIETGHGCGATVESTGTGCGRKIDVGLLCSLHDKVARRRFDKAVSGDRRARYDDIVRVLTVMVGDLADLLAEAEHRHGITVRLRSATIAMFELSRIHRLEDGRVGLSIGHCLNNPRYSGGVYPPLSENFLVDVGLTVWAANGLQETIAATARTVREGEIMAPSGAAA